MQTFKFLTLDALMIRLDQCLNGVQCINVTFLFVLFFRLWINFSLIIII